MNNPSFEDRMIKLEKENRRIKRFLIGLLAVIFVIPLFAFTKSDRPVDAHYRIVYASKFAVKDPRTGKVRAQFAHQTMEGGWAGITLWDNDGKPRAEFKLWEDGRAHLMMMDSRRQELSRLSVSSEGEPAFAFRGKDVIPK